MSFKFYLGLGLLLGLLVFCLCMGNHTRKDISPVEEKAKEALQQAQAGDFTKAAESIQIASRLWDGRRNRLAALSDHDPIDDIDILFQQLPDTGNAPDFLTNCQKLLLLLDSISQDHTLHWWNFL